MFKRGVLAAVLLAVSGASHAAGGTNGNGAVERVITPGKPQVIISPGKQDIIEEYRINGLFYMIKVTPHKGVPYFLVDSDGDGVFETRQSELTPDLLIPRWVLFKF